MFTLANSMGVAMETIGFCESFLDMLIKYVKESLCIRTLIFLQIRNFYILKFKILLAFKTDSALKKFSGSLKKKFL